MDYFLLSGEVVGRAGNRLLVQPPTDRFDHATLRLQLAGDSQAAGAGPCPAEGLGPNPCGPEYRFVPSLLPAFVDALRGARPALEAAATAAAAATSIEQLTAACMSFDGVVTSSLDTAGMPVRQAGPARPPGWQRQACKDPLTSRLRRRRRRALSRRDFTLAVALNRQMCAAARRHKRQVKRKRGRDLARLEFDAPAAFHRLLKGKGEGADPSITAGDWNGHFRSLLGYTHVAAAGRPAPAAAAGAAQAAGAVAGRAHASQLTPAHQQLHEPFTLPELTEMAQRAKNSKASLGALKPEMLKGAIKQLGPSLVALLNACVRIGALPAQWAISALTPIRKPGADHLRCDGYRGIAVGTLPAKLFASMLQSRFTTHTEAAGIRASGQAGFRPGYGCRDQQLALRAIIERQRARGQPLYACYVDFKQAFDRVPRHLLWQKLESAGLGGWALRAVQALYATVPMCVRVPGGYTPTFQATSGVKQGCPLSPILFGLFLDDFESGLVQQAAAAALPRWQSGECVPPLFYADDQALLATTPAGLRFQLGYLESYCAAWGLTVNTKKTQVVVYTTGRAAATEERFRYGGNEVETVPTFRYLGVHLHCRQAFASAASYRAEAGRRAMHLLRRRLAENGLQDPLLSMRAFKSYVLPTLSYGAEIWAPQLILQGRTACERVQLEYLRGLLGVRDSTPALIVLAETGQLPLPAYWTLQVARFVSNLQAMGGERVARLAMLDSVALAADTDTGLPLARQPWAAQVSRVLAAAGAPCDLTADEGVAIPELAEALLERHVASYTHASVKVQRYIEDVWGGSISAEAYTPASFLCDVPERRRRVRLAQWRTGSHWMAEETGRWQRLDRTQRPCPHCQAPLEDVRHAVYDCPLYAGLREEYAELFHSPGHALPSLAAFLGQARQGRLARFADRCHEEHAAALAQ